MVSPAEPSKEVRFWLDIKNSHEPAFFRPFLRDLDEGSWFVTSRHYAEITGLLDHFGIRHTPAGRHYGRNIVMKILGRAVFRLFQLSLVVPRFQLAVADLSPESVLLAKLRRRPAVAFYDNDLPQIAAVACYPLLDHLIVPRAIPPENLTALGARDECLLRLDGYKEEVYIADYRPDPTFLHSLPFREYVVVRPEALKAEYVPRSATTIVPELLRSLAKAGLNILYLPRYPTDKLYATDVPGVYSPPGPLNGLDVCHHAKAVLTGSGTFAREAAVMGVPSVSFFPGSRLLAVDRKLISEGKMIHSRDPETIVGHVVSARRGKLDLERAKSVQSQAVGFIRAIAEAVA